MYTPALLLNVTVHRCLQEKAPRYLVDCCTPVSEAPAVDNYTLSQSTPHYSGLLCHRVTGWARSGAFGPLRSPVLLRGTLRDPTSSFGSSRKLLKTELFCELLNTLCAIDIIHGSALYRFMSDTDIDSDYMTTSVSRASATSARTLRSVDTIISSAPSPKLWQERPLTQIHRHGTLCQNTFVVRSVLNASSVNSTHSCFD